MTAGSLIATAYGSMSLLIFLTSTGFNVSITYVSIVRGAFWLRIRNAAAWAGLNGLPASVKTPVTDWAWAVALARLNAAIRITVTRATDVISRSSAGQAAFR